MRKFQIPNQPETGSSPGLWRSEKVRIVLMAVALLIVGGAFLVSQLKGREYRDAELGDLPPEEPVFVEQGVKLPDMDPSALDALVADAAEADRVVLEPEAVALAAEWSARLTDRHFEALGVRDLDGDEIAELQEDPGEHRGAAYRVRGWIESLQRRSVGEDEEQGFLTRFVLEDESVAYAVILDVPEGQRSPGAFLKTDGLFVKLFSDEAEGGWIEGPLFVAPRAIPSFPAFEDPAELVDGAMEGVTDDGLETRSGLPVREYWTLMAYAKSAAPGAVDWDATPELNRDLLQKIDLDGSPYRGQPMRIPVSKLMGITVRSAAENPARVPRTTEGWIGNTTWKNLISFSAPFAITDVEENDLIEARGFFLKNLAYVPRDGGLHVAPRFVITSMERYVPPRDNTLMLVMYAAIAITVLLAILIATLLFRDKRRSRQLHDELVRRRQARRSKAVQA